MSCVIFSDQSASQHLWVGVANDVILACWLLLVVAYSPFRFMFRFLAECGSSKLMSSG